jgi:hypothetical protein
VDGVERTPQIDVDTVALAIVTEIKSSPSADGRPVPSTLAQPAGAAHMEPHRFEGDRRSVTRERRYAVVGKNSDANVHLAWVMMPSRAYMYEC